MLKCLGFRCLCTLLFTYSKALSALWHARKRKKSNFFWTEMMLTRNLMHWLLILQLFSLPWIFHKVYKTMSYFRLQFEKCCSVCLRTHKHAQWLFLSQLLTALNKHSLRGVYCVILSQNSLWCKRWEQRSTICIY